VSYEFNRSGKRKRGYDTEQVNEFLAFARDQFANPTDSLLTAESVRTKRFKLVKNGYYIAAVDSAMEKLEDVFASRELEKTIELSGLDEFKEQLVSGQELLIRRASKGFRRKFKRRFFFFRGYNRKQVDRFCKKVSRHLKRGDDLSVRQVRLATFKAQRGGYAEYQVDAFIEKVIEVLQREAILEKTSD